MRRTAALTAMVVSTTVLLAAGCSSDPEIAVCPCPDAAAPDAAADALSDVPPAGLEAFCDATLGRAALACETCCTEADKSTWLYHTTHGGALALAWECKDKIAASAMRGRVQLDSVLAEACAQEASAAYDAAGCSIFVTGFAWDSSSCRPAVMGLQQVGQPCRYRYECVAGLTCDGYRDGVDGACIEPPTNTFCTVAELTGAPDDMLDALFGQHPPCSPGFSCLHTDEFGMCGPVVGAGAHCIQTSDCDTGLTCHAGICGTQGPSSEGSACRVSTDCLPGLYCVPPAQAGADGVCAQKKAAGQPCAFTPSDECAGYCGAGLCVAFCASN
jgi:hypothetical protein